LKKALLNNIRLKKKLQVQPLNVGVQVKWKYIFFDSRGEWSNSSFGRFIPEKEPWVPIGEKSDIVRADLYVKLRLSSP
jgi:hypothetical protein